MRTFILTFGLILFIETDSNLQRNRLTGLLPNFPSTLIGLSQLSLSQNNFSGTLSSTISNLLLLSLLELDSNKITGTVPDGVFSLPSLNIVDLSDNLLTGTIPAFSACPELYLVELSNNKFTGTIPDLSGAPNLTSVNFGLNQLTGTIPPTIAEFEHLSAFIARENLLTGTIPTEVSAAKNMTLFDVAYNNLTGSLPTNLHLTSLSHLSCANNKIEGTLPQDLCHMRNLTFINLSSNRFQGTLPDCLGDLLNLTSFYADFNNISGTIPSSMGYLTQLTHIALNSNRLTGAIPKTLGNATQLQSLLLGSNLFDSDVPYELSQLSRLVSLDLSDNQLHGPFPYVIANIPGLTALQISRNLLECPLATLTALKLESCDASHNYICGTNTSNSLFSPSCRLFFPPVCKLTECKTLVEPVTPARATVFKGVDGSSITLNPHLPVIDIVTIDPRTKKTSAVKLEILGFNENILNTTSDLAVFEPNILNMLNASSFTWSLSDMYLSSPKNDRFPYWKYSANIPVIAGDISVSVAFIPRADASLVVYNESLSAVNGEVKITIGSENWQILTRPDESAIWATSTVFRLSTSTDRRNFKTSKPRSVNGMRSTTKVEIPFTMSSSGMTGIVRAIEDGISGVPGTLSPKVRLAYNTTQDMINAEAGTSSIVFASYFPMTSTANVTFEYDILTHLLRTPIPKKPDQIMGSTAGFAILMILIGLSAITLLFTFIMWKFPGARRKLLPCFGRAVDPVEYL